MNGLFDRLAARSQGVDAVVSPRVAALYESTDAAVEGDLAVAEEWVPTGPRPTPAQTSPVATVLPPETERQPRLGNTVEGEPQRVSLTAPTNEAVGSTPESPAAPHPVERAERQPFRPATHEVEIRPERVELHLGPNEPVEFAPAGDHEDRTESPQPAVVPAPDDPPFVAVAAPEAWPVDQRNLPVERTADRMEAEHPAPSPVTVTIGRIEVRSPAPAPTAPRPRARPAIPRVSLGAYLQERR